MDQHRRSPLSQATLQCSPGSSWDPVLTRGLGFSTQLRGLLVPGTGIVPGNGWNSSPVPSMAHRDENEFHPPTMDTTVNSRPLLGNSLDHYPTHSPSDETSVDNVHQWPIVSLCSFRDVFPGPQTPVDVPDEQFAVQSDPMADRTLRAHFPRFDTDSPRSYDQMTTELWVITDIVANSSDHERCTTESQIPMIPFGAALLQPEDRSCSPTSFTHSTGGAMRLRVMSQEINQASGTYNEGDHLPKVTSSPTPLLRSFTPRDQRMGVKDKRYQCGSCYVRFVQRQGLTRHSKDKHKPKKRCGFCAEFTWPQGRRYIYRRHLREEHPGVVSPTPIARRRRVN
ncbi:hypothetical protein H4582DRAFT_469911 [Lactarius indigo]|nr:hypothetical protein H4582DRAFT_469911 [Lactarius indigo]